MGPLLLLCTWYRVSALHEIDPQNKQQRMDKWWGLQSSSWAAHRYIDCDQFRSHSAAAAFVLIRSDDDYDAALEMGPQKERRLRWSIRERVLARALLVG